MRGYYHQVREMLKSEPARERVNASIVYGVSTRFLLNQNNRAIKGVEARTGTSFPEAMREFFLDEFLMTTAMPLVGNAGIGPVFTCQAKTFVQVLYWDSEETRCVQLYDGDDPVVYSYLYSSPNLYPTTFGQTFSEYIHLAVALEIEREA